jgi:hypothetical protein
MERFSSCFALEQFLRGAIGGRKSGRLISVITGVRPVGRVLGNPVHSCAWSFPFSSIQGLSDRIAACW